MTVMLLRVMVSPLLFSVHAAPAAWRRAKLAKSGRAAAGAAAVNVPAATCGSAWRAAASQAGGRARSSHRSTSRKCVRSRKGPTSPVGEANSCGRTVRSKRACRC